MNETTTRKTYIGHIGWSGNTTHTVVVYECTCDKFEGVHSHSDPYAVCKPNLGFHYRIGGVTRIKHVDPTAENVTCKQCKKWL